MPEKIGVYVCHCGVNISHTVDVEAVCEFASHLPNVVVSRDYKYMCSDPGQDIIKKDIKELGLTRVVVASCSPLMHEPTFRYACQEADLNPYLFCMANIREQCSWVTKDKKLATEKAKALVSAAARRVVFQKPLTPREVLVNPATLVVGAGVAGIEAALKIADSGKKVYLLDKESSIGGNMAKFDKTFPTLDCAACILTPKMVQVGRHPNIELLTYSEVQEVSGFVGNFNVKINKKARSIDSEKCTGCGDCITNCPVQYQIYPPKETIIELLPEEKEKITLMISKLKKDNGKGMLVPLLHEITSAYSFLPDNILRYISQELKIPLSQIYQISTFYNAFSLKPKAKYTINVCMGTACYIKGGPKIVEAFERELNIKAGQTTSDLLFGLETKSCFGCCGQAPVITVNEELYGHFGIIKASKLLGEYKNRPLSAENLVTR